MFLRKWFDKNSSFNFNVVSSTLLMVVVLLTLTLLFPEKVDWFLGVVQQGIFRNFSWFYILVVSAFLCFLIVISLSGFGNIKLGSNDEAPEFSFFSWLAMLFAAGMGVGLMFFGVAEPLTHYSSSITTGDSGHMQQEALLHTFFHWGVHAWSIYAVIALALAYFAFRYQLPLSLRSCFYPILKDKVNGKLGDAIDVVALLSTLFGIITTLGLGAAQMAAGLIELGLIDEGGFSLDVIVIAVVMSLAVISAISGVGRGVKLLSEINLSIATLLMLFVLFTGPTLYILAAFSDNLGTYLSHLLGLSFKTYAYEQQNTGWFTGWTVLYWAWWCSWAPFVGLFIARISRGRTIREFIFGVLAVPSLFSVLWFTVFGNSAIWIDEHLAGGALSTLTGAPEVLLFAFFDYLPLPLLTGGAALITIALFFITSADSGIYVLNNIAARDKSLSARRWQAVMWGVLMSLAAIILMRSGGISSLQTMTLVVALPFSMLMLVMCFSFHKAIRVDKKYFDAKVTPSSTYWNGSNWKERLQKILSQTQEKDSLRFLKKTALPAMKELADEMRENYHLNVEVRTLFAEEEAAVEFVVKKDNLRDFMYGIKAVPLEVSKDLIDNEKLPHIRHELMYQLLSYFFDGREGYDVQYMQKNELIADILKQYERYLSLLDNVAPELMSHERSILAE